jgi:dipeptidyl aminopeptidase/acylaminoacyl peptidase
MQWDLATTVSILTLPEKVAPRNAEEIAQLGVTMRIQTLGWIWSLALLGCADFVSAPVEQIGPLIFVESTTDGGQQIGSLTTDGQRGAELGSRHARVVSPRWSPNGGMIAYVGFEDDRIRDLWIVDVDEQGRPGEPRSVLRWDTAEQPPLLHWLPDESGLVWSEMTDTSVALRHLELGSGEDTWHHQTGLWTIDVANDGRIVGRVMVDETDSALAVYDAAFEPLIESEIGLGEMPIWSPDASEVAFVLRDQPGIGVLDPDTGAWQRLTDAPDTDPRWSPRRDPAIDRPRPRAARRARPPDRSRDDSPRCRREGARVEPRRAAPRTTRERVLAVAARHRRHQRPGSGRCARIGPQPRLGPAVVRSSRPRPEQLRRCPSFGAGRLSPPRRAHQGETRS